MALFGDGARILRRPTYAFLRTINEGNTAITKLYEHEVLGGYRVQKTVTVLGVPDGVARSEPRLLEQLDHPHLIKVREAQWDPDFPESAKMITFTTDYYEGQSIHVALADGHPFSTNDSVSIIRCVLDGLHYLHVTARIVHRDIKPGNLMLDQPREQAFVGDFGSAAYLDSATGQVIAAAGTLLYRPPEYADGHLDERSDLYSAGMTMFELLNGAFDYEALDQDALERRSESGKPAVGPKHLTFRPWVSPQVATFVRTLMHANPDQRFPSAAAALRALHELRYVDWVRTGVGEWEGRWPPHQAPSRQRLLRVISEPMTGRFTGTSKVTAFWSVDGGRNWRGYARLARRVATDDDVALAGFFRSVEAAAQAVPVR